jgi:Domain of unknown function (DUF1906)/FG-GAP-like repeat
MAYLLMDTGLDAPGDTGRQPMATFRRAFGRGSRIARTANRLLSTGVAKVLMLAGLAAPASAAARPAAPPAPQRAALAAVAAVAPGTYTGLGFDTCAAPSQAAMTAWLQSPYRAIGIYIGGIGRGCPTQTNLTPTWVQNQQAAGWHLVPIYVGLQAPCLATSKPKIDPAMAGPQGRASADDAVSQAASLGLPAGSMIVYDMEAYTPGDVACRSAVLTFTSAWNARLHERGYYSGFYSSMNSGVADQVAAYYSPGGYVKPDYLDFARWDGVVTVDDPAIPATYWAPHRRMKQYQGDHLETWGGVTINIDNDYLDFGPVPATPFGDFAVNGWSDLMGRQTSNGALNLYPGNGTLTGPVLAGTGWGGMDVIIRHGDFTGDGFEDVITRVKSNGDLLLYPGTGSGLTYGPRIGIGWNIMREINLIGDFDRDGRNDLVAIESATGRLLLYPGRGNSIVGPVQIGTGWNGMDELTGTGDFNRDGYVDLAARERATGNLLLFLGSASGLTYGPGLGTGWNGFRDIVSIGDFDRDGYNDLMAIEQATGNLYLYTGNGTGLTNKIRIGIGWGGIQPLF